MDSGVNAGSGDQSDKQTGASTPVRQVPGLVAFMGLLILTQHARDEGWPTGMLVVLGLAALGCLAWLWRKRRGFLPNLTTVAFSAGLLVAVTLATAVGTLVQQGEPPALADGRHVSLGTQLAGLFFLNDLFHSFWFGGLLALLAGSLILTVLWRRFWRPRFWGFTLAHGGMALLIVGAAVGSRFGVTGQMPLIKGEQTDHFAVRQGGRAEELRPLGFALRLDAFDVEKYPRRDPGRLAVYREAASDPHAKEEERCPALVCAATIAGARNGFDVPSTGLRIQLREFYPDAQILETMEEAGGTDWPPALQIRLTAADQQEQHWVAEGAPPHTAENVPGLEIEWGPLDDGATGPAEAWTSRTQQSRPAAHRLAVPGSAEPLAVRVGETYTLPGGKARFKVSGFYPDFSYDIRRHEAFSVSDEPRNPALAVVVLDDPAAPPTGKTQYLFSGQGGHMDQESPLGLAYRYAPPVNQVPHLIRLDGRARQFAYATAGREVLRRPFAPGQPQEVTLEAALQSDRRAVNLGGTGLKPVLHLGGTGLKPVLHLEVTKEVKHARPKRQVKLLSEKIGNTAALVAVQPQDGSAAGKEFLLDSQDQPSLGLDDDLTLVLETPEQEIKAFRSYVSILRNGQAVGQAVVAVNSPLSVDGYSFYQTDYHPDDPNFSGLRVVRDPGLGLVYLGMILVALGLTYTLYVRPRLRPEGTPEEAAR